MSHTSVKKAEEIVPTVIINSQRRQWQEGGEQDDTKTYTQIGFIPISVMKMYIFEGHTDPIDVQNPDFDAFSDSTSFSKKIKIFSI